MSCRVLQLGRHAARREDREMQRVTRHAHNVHRHAASSAALGVRPVHIAHWSGGRRTDAAYSRDTSRREASHPASSGRLTFYFIVQWHITYEYKLIILSSE